jgi:uracil-DNA glycosylase
MTNLIDEIKQCNSCLLRCNQIPLLDQNSKEGNVFWIGLSAVKVKNVEDETPLSPYTNSGRLISEIEKMTFFDFFYKTNVIKCLPLNEGKIRYPSSNEMKSCFHNLELELTTIKPKLVFLLGKQVADFVGKKFNLDFGKLDDDFDYGSVTINNIEFVPIHHPSYILVYKRKKIETYRDKISQMIKVKFAQHYIYEKGAEVLNLG